MDALNLFYEEPDRDRWLPLDRYPRRMIRRIVRGSPPIGGMMRYFANLCAGLDQIGVPYRINQYRHIQKHTDEIACIIGKPQVLNKRKWENPILFGPAVYSHPCDDPNLLERLPIQKVLVSCDWFKAMYCQLWSPSQVEVWPAGIDTSEWEPSIGIQKDIDILIYDKVRWERDRYQKDLISPIQSQLSQQQLTSELIQYGFYREEDFQQLLKRSKAMIFLCEHETQGFAYLQALASDVPILAWDRGGFWQDPTYYPHRVQFQSVSAVPYWDDRCGLKFKDFSEFPHKLEEFLGKLDSQLFSPRDYILENLSLERCARHYVEIWHQIQANSS
jgi:hypothetical protein